MRIELRLSLMIAATAVLLPLCLAAQAPEKLNFAHLQPLPSAWLTMAQPTAPGGTSQPPAQAAVVALPAGRGFPRYEWFVGYSNLRAFPGAGSDNRLVWASGLSSSLALNFNRVVGLVFDFGGYHVNKFAPGPPNGGVVPARGYWFSYMVGPRISWRHSRFTPFAQALVGGNDATSVVLRNCSGPGCTPLPAQTALAFNAGGGLDITLTRHLALRLFQAEYAWTRFPNPSTSVHQRTSQNDVRLSTGLVFRFGGDHPVRVTAVLPPSATCVAAPVTVAAGTGDLVAVSAQASDPNGYPLAYTWTAQAGSLQGNGPNVQWNSAAVPAGTYNITGQVNDDHGGTASCSTAVTVSPAPAVPMTLSCSANPPSLTAGESALLTAVASGSDPYPLAYSWSSSRNATSTPGPTTTFDSTDLAAGSYTENAHVDDGHGATADCSVNLDVAAAPPTAAPLEAVLALNSVYFPTNQPRPGTASASPYSGLLASQKAVLVVLAADFKQYLVLNPNARLTLEGHADDRASYAYNQALAMRRATVSEQFLIDQGVPANRLTTKSFGKHQELNAAQVRSQMEANPALTPAQRRAVLANLPSIILAQNRRVDILLNPGNRQSVRQYPFNAYDALTLLSDKALNR